MVAYLCYSVVVAGFIYPVIAHTIWSHSGYLSGTNDDPFMGSGAIDFAGSGVVHMTGGTIALVATIILGPRRGRFYDAQGEPLDTPKVFPGHSVALQMLGTMVLWFGWFGFNSGSSLLLIKNQNYGFVASNAAVSTALSGATGGITALFTNVWAEQRRTGEPKFVIGMAMNGALSGLVASTSGCALVTPGMAIITGLIAGWLYMWASSFLLRVKIDDAVDAIPVHMFSGAWGMIATGLFAHPDRLELTYGSFDNPGVFYSFGGERGANAVLLVNQICAVLFIAAWCIFTMLPFFVFLNYMGWLRADSLEELVGLDMSYHGATLNAANGGKSQEQVKKSYVDAYNRHKFALRKRKTETMESEDIENADTDASGTSHEKM
jgi:Amt family ammonium transporter